MAIASIKAETSHVGDVAEAQVLLKVVRVEKLDALIGDSFRQLVVKVIDELVGLEQVIDHSASAKLLLSVFGNLRDRSVKLIFKGLVGEVSVAAHVFRFRRNFVRSIVDPSVSLRQIEDALFPACEEFV